MTMTVTYRMAVVILLSANLFAIGLPNANGSEGMGALFLGTIGIGLALIWVLATLSNGASGAEADAA